MWYACTVVAIVIAAAAIGILSITSLSATSQEQTSSLVASENSSLVWQGTMNSTSNNEKLPTVENDLYPVIRQTWSKGENVTSSTDATALAGFDVIFPNGMDSLGYKLQLAIADKKVENNPYVWLFYSKEPMTSNMTLEQFWSSGVIINYHQVVIATPTGSSSSVLPSQMTPTIVNGHPAAAMEGQFRNFERSEIHDPSQFDFIYGNTYVTLQGYASTDQLEEIASSISA